VSTKPITWVKYEKNEENSGRFIVSPLERGMGLTLGNSLRRILLSSLSGYAVKAIKIEGVKHEFSTVPNVVEDVLDIICNLKELVIKSSGTEDKKAQIEIDKKKKVLAKDIVCSSDIEIVNKDQFIAEVNPGGKLKIDLTIGYGTGYVDNEEKIQEGLEKEIDTIYLDASYSPILKVNHEVESIRVGEKLDNDRLVLDIWTNGSIEPDEAIKSAAKILESKLELFHQLNEEPQEEVTTQDDEGDKNQDEALNLTIDDLELSARSSNCLKKAGIETVRELVEKDPVDLIQIKNFGKKSADEINAKLKQYNLALKGQE
jgi:DNA-directed RNA polymerase subunit alpha